MRTIKRHHSFYV